MKKSILVFALLIMANICFSQATDTVTVSDKSTEVIDLDRINKQGQKKYVTESDINFNIKRDAKYVYCLLMGTAKLFSFKVKIEIDFGQARNFWSTTNQKKLRDSSGKAVEFESMMDALNYMSNLGWEFVQAYVITVPSGLGGQQNVYHYLMRQEIPTDND